MRIISGRFKNKKLYFPENLKTRPLKDSVRENIFNIIYHSNKVDIDIRKSYVLDLYAGCGSFGLECISREASKVIFVENDNEAIKNLKKNIKSLNSENKTALYAQDVSKILNSLNLETEKDKINIIFLDPPYKNTEYLKTIEIMKKKSILNKKHIFIIHREKNSEKNIKNYLDIIEKRVYGRSEIFFGKLI